jgi:hypothetical protein
MDCHDGSRRWIIPELLVAVVPDTADFLAHNAVHRLEKVGMGAMLDDIDRHPDERDVRVDGSSCLPW